MRNKVFLSTLRSSSVFDCLRATVMAASSALFIVCRSGCDLIWMCGDECDWVGHSCS